MHAKVGLRLVERHSQQHQTNNRETRENIPLDTHSLISAMLAQPAAGGTPSTGGVGEAPPRGGVPEAEVV